MSQTDNQSPAPSRLVATPVRTLNSTQNNNKSSLRYPSENIIAQNKQDEKHLLRISQAECDELRDALRLVEIQYGKERDKNIEQKRNHDNVLVELDTNRKTIAKNKSMNKDIENKYHVLQNKYNDSTVTQQHLIEKIHDKVKVQQEELDVKDYEVVKLKDELKKQTNELSSNRINNDTLCLTKHNNEEKISNIERELKKYKTLQDNLLKENENQKLDKRSEGTALLELEHLKRDNRRLISLLGKTKLKGLDELNDDSGGDITYIGNPKLKKHDLVESEQDNWIPSDTFRIAHEFRTKFGGELSPTLINRLLAELNRIWKDRERRQIERIRYKCTKEVMSLKRQLNMRVPYDEVQTKRELERLRVELQRSRKEVREIMYTKANAGRRPDPVDYVDADLKVFNKMTQDKKFMDGENEYLKNRVMHLENLVQSNELNRMKWMEGASWMAGKCKSTVNNQLSEALDKNVIKEYKNKIKYQEESGNIDLSYPVKLQDQFINKLEDYGKELIEEITGHQESSVFNQETSFKKVDDIIRGTSTVVSEFKYNTMLSPERKLADL